MQKREKILAAALGGVLLLWFGLPWFEGTFLAPLRELERDEEMLQETVAELFEQRKQLAIQEQEFGEWIEKSLPPNPLNAQRLYQEWLVNLAQLSGFEQITVDLQPVRHEGETFANIPIVLKAKGTLQELALFLDRFESVELLHRIAQCDITSPAAEGNPKLDLVLTAEGVAIKSAPERARLFPQTDLVEELPREAKEISVSSTLGFPEQPPFRVRIGNEFLNVVEADGYRWTTVRGVARTFAERHAEAATIELFPLREEVPHADDDVEAVWARSIFTKPAPKIEYRPRLASTSPPMAVRGRRWSWELEVSDWNPEFGSPRFELISAPERMRVNERTGQIEWTVAEEVALGRHPLEVLVWGQTGKDAGFTSRVNVTVRDPNTPPRFDETPPLRFYLGRESQVQLKASDPDNPNERLTFELEGAPEGMTIDPATGVIRWTPEETLDTREFPVTVTVTDADPMPESASVELTVTLEEDSARFAYLVGTFSRKTGEDLAAAIEEKEAWIFDRATNRRTVVKEGDAFHIADFELTVKQIGSDYILVERGEELYRWEFEQPLVEIKPAPQTAETRSF
jgi:hypothetical protein